MSENKKLDKITAVKGMNDILPADAPLWELFENTAQSVLQSYGFQKFARRSWKRRNCSRAPSAP